VTAAAQRPHQRARDSDRFIACDGDSHRDRVSHPPRGARVLGGGYGA
jgi:hypothetical protein